MNITNNSTKEELTSDTLFSGDIVCAQNRNGYRFSVDSVLLSHFVDVNGNDKILDLGTGCGVITLILLYRFIHKIKHISAIEVQEQLCTLAKLNIESNNFSNTAQVIKGNVSEIKKHFPPESFDKIVCNPPFYKIESGRVSKGSEASIARHQITASLQNFIEAAAYCMKNRGGAYFIYPAEMMTELLTMMCLSKLEPKIIRFIYSYPAEQAHAKLLLIKCTKNGRKGVEILPPFYIYNEKNGNYTEEMQEFYEKNQ